MTYSAIIAIILVHVLLGLWIFTVWNDDAKKKRYIFDKNEKIE